MKHTHLTRILSLVLALVLVLGVSPVVRAETLETVNDDAVSIMETMEAGGNAPTLNGSLSDFATHQENEGRNLNNNSIANAYGVNMGMSILGATNSNDKDDFYKFTLSSTTHVSLASICNSDNMAFTLHDNKGNTLEVCTYYGTADGWNVDAIRVMLPAGTYYVRLYQIASATTSAYARQVDYVIEFHAHTITGSATGNALTKTHSFKCTSCGTVSDEQCYYVNGRCSYCGTAPTSLVKRVSGNDRFGTNLEILNKAGVSRGKTVLVCTAFGFADSLSASATGLPILLVGNSLTAEQRSFLSNVGGSIVIIGGTSAVSSSVESQLRSYGSVTRLAGANRYESSVKVAKTFFSNPYTAVLAYAMNYPDGLCGGPLAYAMGGPLILTDSNYQVARSYTVNTNIIAGYVLGGNKLVTNEATRWIFSLNRTEPIPAA